MNDVLILLAVIFVVPLIMVLYQIADERNTDAESRRRGQELDSEEKKIVDFTPTTSVSGHFNTYRISIDKDRHKILIMQGDDRFVIPFEDVLKITVKEDGNQVISKSSSRTIGGAIVGGAIAGEAGAIVGGLSGDQTIKKKIWLVQVAIKLRDITHPSIEIDCFNTTEVCYQRKPMDSGSELHKKVSAEAQRIVDLIGVIIDQVDKEEKAKPVTIAKLENPTLEDLERLAGLLDRGVITQDEFNEKKKVILSRI